MDHLSSTILMCAILLLFYASGTVKGVVFGGNCSSGTCDDSNNACISNKCECSTSAFRNQGNTECVTRASVNGTCSNTETAANQCSDENSKCSIDGASAYRCFCTSTYFDMSGTCTSRKKPGETCTSYQCVANAMCNATCACNTGYTATPASVSTSCESSDEATIMLAHMYVFIFGTVASLYFLV